MRNLIRAAVLCAALPAGAQPMSEPRVCEVSIVRAPDDVRQVVEAWVRTEAQCSISLEIRIVPTEGGLYLLAQDERGRLRERIVPDAQTAGVLVASWIADDRAPEPRAPAPMLAPPARTTPMFGPVESLSPPGMVPVSMRVADKAPRSKWLTAGALVPMSDASSAGVRAEVDVIRRDKWTLGAAGSVASNETMLGDGLSQSGYLQMDEARLLAYVARASAWGKWHLRPAVGAGVVHSSGNATMYASGSFYSLSGTFPTVEGSLAVTRELGKRWAAYVAPVASLVSQRYEVMSYSASDPLQLQRSGFDVSLFSGVRYRL